MALSQNPYVYMEAVETAENEEEKPNADGNNGTLRKHRGKQSERSLENIKLCDSENGNDKRKTDKQRLL